MKNELRLRLIPHGALKQLKSIFSNLKCVRMAHISSQGLEEQKFKNFKLITTHNCKTYTKNIATQSAERKYLFKAHRNEFRHD